MSELCGEKLRYMRDGARTGPAAGIYRCSLPEDHTPVEWHEDTDLGRRWKDSLQPVPNRADKRRRYRQILKVISATKKAKREEGKNA